MAVGWPGRPPRLVTTWKLGRVTFCVEPPAVTLMLLPNTKVDVVWLGFTSRSVMPPRMPIVLEGVLMVIGVVLLILPPTRRRTPLLALMASSPVLLLGSKTNLSMVSWALGPT